MNINLIHTNNKFIEGINKYGMDLLNGLRINNINVNSVLIKKYEIKVNNKKYGGWISREISEKFINLPINEVNHSIDHWNIVKATNIITIHDIIPYYYSDEYKLSNIALKYYEKAFNKIGHIEFIIVLSRHVYNTLYEKANKYIEGALVYVIPRGVNKYLNVGLISPYPDDNKIHLITVGDFNKRKRFDLLYEYVKDLKDVHLYHIGKVSDIESYERAMRNINNNVSYLGYIPDSTIMHTYIKFAHKFVYNTLDEGQGMPSLEAMRLGTQPVVNNIEVHKEILGVLPYYYNNKDEFVEQIYKPNNDSSILSNYVSKYDDWISKHISAYEDVWNQIK